MECVKTCVNCDHYHPILCDDSKGTSDGSRWHTHDYCDVWKKNIPDDILFTRAGFDHGFTDIECGLTSCFAFEPSKSGIYVKKFPSLGD